MRNIGLLTGTFDPVHLGHVALAQAAMSECALDEVWFLINPDPTHKATVTSYADRLEMVELAIAGLPGLQVYRGDRAAEPHVIATFEAIALDYSECKFVHILGVDTFVRLDGWQEVESVVDKASYAVAFRPGTPSNAVADLRTRLGKLADHLEIRRFEFDDHGMASSTDIRRQVRAGGGTPSLNRKVHDYVVRHGLYEAA